MGYFPSGYSPSKSHVKLYFPDVLAPVNFVGNEEISSPVSTSYSPSKSHVKLYFSDVLAPVDFVGNPELLSPALTPYSPYVSPVFNKDHTPTSNVPTASPDDEKDVAPYEHAMSNWQDTFQVETVMPSCKSHVKLYFPDVFHSGRPAKL